MAGIFDRIGVADNVSVHLLKAAIYLGVQGTFTDPQILAALNARLETNLDAAAQTDLTNIKTQAALGAAADQAQYIHGLEAIAIAVEEGGYSNEAGFRSFLGIT